MKLYFAPMEGITGYIYRNAYEACYHSVDKYFTPFLSPNRETGMKKRERKDILPEHNKEIKVIPQILTNQSECFIKTAKELEQYGYHEINFNLGCPSGTVVSKKKGSGFLAYPEELDRFLNEIFSALSQKISIKSRIGKKSPEEFQKLLTIYNQYPLEELIIHPRLQIDYYKNKPNLTVFEQVLKESKNPICYNGDLHSIKNYNQLKEQFPELHCFMLGRGILANPDLPMELRKQEKLKEEQLSNFQETKVSCTSVCGREQQKMEQKEIQEDRKQLFKKFHDQVVAGYFEIMSGERDVLFKMKELWFYQIHSFTNAEKYGKKIKKAQKFSDYQRVVESLFAEEELKENAGFQP